MSKNADEPVSPIHGFPAFKGLTKRELIAAMAMHGLAANPKAYEMTAEEVAGFSRQYADALLAELERRDD